MTPLHPRIAAVVVLYRPGPEVIDNIRTWADQVETVFAVDNTELPGMGTGGCREAGAGISGGTGDTPEKGEETFADRLAVFGNVTWLPQGENVGIARALNIGAELAMQDGFDFLLTMDQDSQAAPDMVSCMLGSLDGLDRSRVGIISPFHVTKAEPSPKSPLFCREVLTVMTSGNLLDLNVYKKVGPFRDDLFIDFVDHEFCLRLREKNYKVIQVNRALLSHNVGDIVVYRFFGLRLVATNHSALRRYYKTRNRFYVVRRYKKVSQSFYYENIVRFIKELIVIALFEKNRAEQYRMIVKGYADYRRNRFGKYVAPAS